MNEPRPGERPARQRVAVTSRRRMPTPPRYPVRREIDEHTEVGGVYVRTLMRAQLRLALTTCLLATLILGAIPVLFWAAPELRAVRVLGIGLPWLVLGVLVYPFVLAMGWVQARAAERREREFTELVDRQ